MHNTDAAADLELVIVGDGGPADQQWMDAFIMSAQSGAGDWPHGHPDIPRTTVTRDQVWLAIAENVQIDGGPWSVAELGYPPITGPSSPMLAARPRPPHDDPNRGSVSHNLLHSILGNFH
ncbi:hypothetical protein [Actinoplanes sp. NPDC049265]|uniref:hypothetical protein n=1 Tax=Actinoplanes sp. NPDC049265 TaxID=3363902 RepID=UPI003710EF89